MTKKKTVPMNRRKRRRRRSRINWRAVAAMAAIVLALIVLIVCGVNALSKKNNSNSSTSNKETEAATVVVEETTTEAPPVEIDIMMIGDMLIHTGVISSGLQDDGTYNYDHLYANILSDIQAADVRIVNQETIFAGPDYAYTGYPTFNTPSALADAEVKAGFNVVLHATNHTLDKGKTGTENCMEYWKTHFPQTHVLGISNTQEEYDNNMYIHEKNGFRVAFLNYTYGTNGIPIPDSKPYIVNMLYKYDDDGNYEINDEKIRADVAKAKSMADMVVVCPHWGTEYVYKPDSSQLDFTEYFSDLGVDVLLGTHPHVLEPVEVVKNEKTGKEMLVYYSLGNFVSNQDARPRMIGGMAKLTLVKDKNGCYVKKYNLTPIVTHKLFGPKLITSYKLQDYNDSLASSNAIRNDAGCSDFNMEYIHSLCEQILGEQYDRNTSQLNVDLHPNGITPPVSTAPTTAASTDQTTNKAN